MTSTINNSHRTPSGVNMNYTSFGYAKKADAYDSAQVKTSNTYSKGRPGGGWADDEDYSNNHVKSNNNKENTFKGQSNSIPSSQSQQKNEKISSSKINITEDQDIISVDYEFIIKNEYENKVVSDITLPGGMGLKQPNATLKDFCDKCETLKPQVIGSLLIHNLKGQVNWISKARALYAIEALIKKLESYFQFFKYNIKTVRKIDFLHEDLNGSQLHRILDNVLEILEQANFPHPKPKEFAPQRVASSNSAISTDTEEAPNTLEVEQKKSNNSTTKPKVFVLAPPKKAVNTSVASVSNTSNTTVNQTLNNSRQKVDSLANLLADCNFSENSNTNSGASPNNLYQMYNAAGSPVNFAAASPIGMPNYNNGYYNYPNNQYNNYPVNHMNNNIGFYNHPNTQMYGNTGPLQPTSNMNFYQNNMGNGYNGNANTNAQVQENNGAYDKWDPSVFKQESEIDYDAETKKQQAKHAEIEKKFDSLSFNF